MHYNLTILNDFIKSQRRSHIASNRNFKIISTSIFLFFFLFLFSGNAFSQKLKINDQEYFETQGVNVLVFSNQYNGMFFDEKTAGIEIIQHGVRTSGHQKYGQKNLE